MLATLDHPNVLHYRDFYETREGLHLVTDYIPGKNLFDLLLRRPRGFSECKVAKILRQLLFALEHCHERGVIHRDVKPENIMLSPDGHATLIDFGLSEFASHKDNDLAGSPYYLAPETIAKSYDERCDIWGAGVVAYVLLTTDPMTR